MPSKIFINDCPAEEFQKIKGIGKVIAARIDERRKKQPFISIDEMIQVEGLGKRLVENITKYVLTSAYCNKVTREERIKKIDEYAISTIRDYSYLTQEEYHKKLRDIAKSKSKYELKVQPRYEEETNKRDQYGKSGWSPSVWFNNLGRNTRNKKFGKYRCNL